MKTIATLFAGLVLGLSALRIMIAVMQVASVEKYAAAKTVTATVAASRNKASCA